MLDGNVFNLLNVHNDTRTIVLALVGAGCLTLLVNPTIVKEVRAAPDGEALLNLLPLAYTSNTVGRVDVMTCEDSIGDGQVFDAHLGDSKRIDDALIADAASWKADWLVTEDRRLRDRLNRISQRCEGVSYAEFARRIKSLSAQPANS